MKVILYMAVSANGIIAKTNDDTSWISEKEWDSYAAAVKKAGCLIVGRRTYHILTRQPEFSELKDVRLVAVSEKDFKTSASNHFVAHSPREALKMLKDSDEVIVAGGGTLNASFLAENLIDEIYLDVEPILLGEGVPLFKNKDFERRLEFLDQKQISPNGLQLHYKVFK